MGSAHFLNKCDISGKHFELTWAVFLLPCNCFLISWNKQWRERKNYALKITERKYIKIQTMVISG